MSRGKWVLVLIVVVVLAVVAGAYAAGKAKLLPGALGGFKISVARFDESLGSRPLPTIPKSWRFVGVSNGRAMNSNALWFQSPDGNIYRVEGFVNSDKSFASYGKFTLEEDIAKIAAGE